MDASEATLVVNIKIQMQPPPRLEFGVFDPESEIIKAGDEIQIVKHRTKEILAPSDLLTYGYN